MGWTCATGAKNFESQLLRESFSHWLLDTLVEYAIGMHDIKEKEKKMATLMLPLVQP